MAVLCSCPKQLFEAKVKSFGLIPVAKGISKRPNTDYVGWLLVFTRTRFYEKEQVEQVKMQNVQVEEKGETRVKWS